MSEEGIEMIVDFKSNFKALAYNKIPLLENGIWKDCLYHVCKPKLELYDVLKRLQRKYQAYKSSYFLEGKTSEQNLYSSLITVDDHDFCNTDLSFTFLHWSII
jgi:hypothetical protein